MPYTIMEQKISSLSAEQRQSVFDYVNFLVYQNSAEKERKTTRRSPGGLTGAFYMADDFDETPECFKDFV